jgi:hypothetical protein
MEQPEGYQQPQEHLLFRLHKALYELKQSLEHGINASIST